MDCPQISFEAQLMSPLKLDSVLSSTASVLAPVALTITARLLGAREPPLAVPSTRLKNRHLICRKRHFVMLLLACSS